MCKGPEVRMTLACLRNSEKADEVKCYNEEEQCTKRGWRSRQGWHQVWPCVVRGGDFIPIENGKPLGAGFKQERDMLCNT